MHMGGRDIFQICGASSLEVCVEGLLRMKLFKNSEELRENSEEILAFSTFFGNFFGQTFKHPSAKITLNVRTLRLNAILEWIRYGKQTSYDRVIFIFPGRQ